MRKLTFPLMLASCGAGMVLNPDSHAPSFGMIRFIRIWNNRSMRRSVSNSPADGVTLGMAASRSIGKKLGKWPAGNRRLQLQLDGSEQSGVLRIRSIGPIGEPVAVIRLRNQCDNSGNIVREFTFFLDPQPEIRLKEKTMRRKVPAASICRRAPRQYTQKKQRRTVKEIWTVKRGDTLTHIAQHFEPDPAQQKAMAKGNSGEHERQSADPDQHRPEAGESDRCSMPPMQSIPIRRPVTKAGAQPQPRIRKRRTDPPCRQRHRTAARRNTMKLTPTQPGGMPPGG